MRICAIVKYPPIQGGVSAQSYWLCRALAECGHHVTVVTNAAEVEPAYRMWLEASDLEKLQGTFVGGGSLDVVWTGAWSEASWHHIPAGNPSLERLSSVAIETVRQHGSDLILSYYLQPYGIAAAYTSRVTGVPFITQHAGSDRYSLMKNAELGTIYGQVLRDADGIIVNGDNLAGFGISGTRLINGPVVAFMPDTFTPDGPALDIQAAIARMAKLGCPAITNEELSGPGKSLIGIYGKVGRAKGTRAVLEAVSASAQLRECTGIVMMCGGALMQRVIHLIEELGVGRSVWTLPFLPHWRVPEFIRACDAIAVLEHDFPIPQHGPSLLREVLACGGPVVASAEVASKLPQPLRTAAGMTVVQDPGDQSAVQRGLLAALAEDQARPCHNLTAGIVGQSRRELDGVIDRIESFVAHLPGGGRSVRARTEEKAARAAESGDQAALARDLLGRYAPNLMTAAGPEIAAWLRELAQTPGELMPARLVSLVDEAVSRHDGDPQWQPVLAEADLLWLGCDVETAAGSPAFRLPPGGLPPDVADIDGWADATEGYRPCPLASSMLRLRQYPAPALRTLLSRREFVLGSRLGQVPDGPAEASGEASYPVVIAKDRGLEGQVYLVSYLVHDVLRLADGTRIAQEIDDMLRISEPRLDELLRSLTAAGLIRWIWYPRPLAEPCDGELAADR